MAYIREIAPTHVRLDQAEDHIRNLVAIINALVPEKDYDCGLRSILGDVEDFLEDSTHHA